MTSAALKAVQDMLAAVPNSQDQLETARQKADIIMTFAEQVAERLLAAFGTTSNSNPTNCLAAGGIDPDVPDSFTALHLGTCNPSLLPQNSNGDFMIAWAIEFCPERVLCRPASTYYTPGEETEDEWLPPMTYEEAARFVIFHLMEQILQVVRAMPWDRAQNALPLLDRMETLIER